MLSQEQLEELGLYGEDDKEVTTPPIEEKPLIENRWGTPEPQENEEFDEEAYYSNVLGGNENPEPQTPQTPQPSGYEQPSTPPEPKDGFEWKGISPEQQANTINKTTDDIKDLNARLGYANRAKPVALQRPTNSTVEKMREDRETLDDGEFGDKYQDKAFTAATYSGIGAVINSIPTLLKWGAEGVVKHVQYMLPWDIVKDATDWDVAKKLEKARKVIGDTDVTPDITDTWVEGGGEIVKEYQKLNDGSIAITRALPTGIFQYAPTILTTESLIYGKAFKLANANKKPNIMESFKTDLKASTAGAITFNAGMNPNDYDKAVEDIVKDALIGAGVVTGLHGIKYGAKNITFTDNRAFKKLVASAELHVPPEQLKGIKLLLEAEYGKPYAQIDPTKKANYILNSSTVGRQVLEASINKADSETIRVLEAFNKGVLDSVNDVTKGATDILQLKNLPNKAGEMTPVNGIYALYKEAGGESFEEALEVFNRLNAIKKMSNDDIANMSSSLKALEFKWTQQADFKVLKDGTTEPLDLDLRLVPEQFEKELRTKLSAVSEAVRGLTDDDEVVAISAELMDIMFKRITKKGANPQVAHKFTPSDVLETLNLFMARQDKSLTPSKFNDAVRDIFMGMYTETAGKKNGNIFRAITEGNALVKRAMEGKNTFQHLVSQEGAKNVDSVDTQIALNAMNRMDDSTYKTEISVFSLKDQEKIEKIRAISLMNKNLKYKKDVVNDLTPLDKKNEAFEGVDDALGNFVTPWGKAFKERANAVFNQTDFKTTFAKISTQDQTDSTWRGRIANLVMHQIWGAIAPMKGTIDRDQYSIITMQKLIKAYNPEDAITFTSKDTKLAGDSFLEEGSDEFMRIKQVTTLLNLFSKEVSDKDVDLDTLEALFKYNDETANMAVLTPKVLQNLDDNAIKQIEKIGKQVKTDTNGITTVDYGAGIKEFVDEANTILTDKWAVKNKPLNKHGLVMDASGKVNAVISKKNVPINMNWSQLQPKTTYNLGDLIGVKTLNDWIPDIDFANIKVRVVDKPTGSKGSFRPQTGIIELNKDELKSWADGSSTLFREVQSLIQKKFNMPSGNNATTAQRTAQKSREGFIERNLNIKSLKNAPTTVRALHSAIERISNNITASSLDKSFVNPINMYNTELKALSDNLDKTPAGKQLAINLANISKMKDVKLQTELLNDVVKNILTKKMKPKSVGVDLDKFIQGSGKLAHYWGTLGEVNSKLVQSLMSKMGLKNISPTAMSAFHIKHRDVITKLRMYEKLGADLGFDAQGGTGNIFPKPNALPMPKP